MLRVEDLAVLYVYNALLNHCPLEDVAVISNIGQVAELRLSCYLVLLSVDSKTR